MSDLRPRGIPIVLDGVERRFLFTLTVVDEIQDDTKKSMQDVIRELTEEDTLSNTARYLTLALINDEARREKKKKEPNPELTEVTMEDVSDMIGLDNILDVTAAILRAYGYSLPEPEDDDPNRTSGQQSR